MSFLVNNKPASSVPADEACCCLHSSQAIPLSHCFHQLLFEKVAPATGTVVRGGLNYREALYVAEACAETGWLGSMDLVEVNADLAEASAAAETVQLGLVAVASAMGSRIL